MHISHIFQHKTNQIWYVMFFQMNIMLSKWVPKKARLMVNTWLNYDSTRPYILKNKPELAIWDYLKKKDGLTRPIVAHTVY